MTAISFRLWLLIGHFENFVHYLENYRFGMTALVPTESGNSGLNIDEVAADSLEMPDLPEPALNLEDLDLALNHPGILPPGTEWRRLDVGSYALRLPGMAQEVRVTTQSDIFDDHFESHEFMSPGGPLFEQVASQCLIPDEGGKESLDGRVWLVRDSSSEGHRFVDWKHDYAVDCVSLASLLDSIVEDLPLGQLDASMLKPTEAARALA